MNSVIRLLTMLSVIACLGPCCGKEVRAADNPKEITRTYQVEGMTCGGCEAGIKLSLKGAGFGKNVLSVSHENGRVMMQFAPEEFGKDTDCKIIKAIQSRGYIAYVDASNKNPCPK
ncbi:MAG: heavy-metal-associated domain-containing protein [Deltaproteobacteria bacterium]|nr:heavy-metal-associated domain-containing protein [Deltaproteobacteria bacterium]